MDERKSLADANKSEDSNAADKDARPVETESAEELKKLKAEIAQLKETENKTVQAQKKEEKLERSDLSDIKALEKHDSEIIQKVNALKEQASQEMKAAHVSLPRQKKGSRFAKLITKLRSFRFGGIKSKLGHYWFEYSRVINLARKPTRKEYRELAIMVIVGTLIIGGIGFVVQLAIQFI